MYIENKGDEQIIGFGSIGRVSFPRQVELFITRE